jgi:hypothetical protein
MVAGKSAHDLYQFCEGPSVGEVGGIGTAEEREARRFAPAPGSGTMRACWDS